MKVIASSLRKGNVLEIDGKLYAVLTVSNFHPGKGTPTTSADLRRLADGIKVSERWRTVEQVERVNVDEREYGFLYEDGEGYHFMEPETFEQIAGSSRGKTALQAIVDHPSRTISCNDVDEMLVDDEDEALSRLHALIV